MTSLDSPRSKPGSTADEVRVFVGLGSNLGDRREHLRNALQFLSSPPCFRLGKVSSIYETVPFGPIPQPRYLNAVLEVYTSLPPRRLLERFKAFEKSTGRSPGVRWGPRCVDLDILTYGKQVVFEDELQIPHREIVHRAFVLVPLAEIAPDLCLPGMHRSVENLRRERGDLADIVCWGSF